MTEKSSDPDPGRRLPLWARVVLWAGLPPIILLAPFVVLALWPGLNFEWSIGDPESARYIHVRRVTHPSLNLTLVGVGSGMLAWERMTGGFFAEEDRGLRMKRTGIIWRRSAQQFIVQWRRSPEPALPP